MVALLARTKRVFALFGLTWSIFIKSLKVLVFSGVEKKMPENVYSGLSHLWLVWPQRVYLRTRVEHFACCAGAGTLSVHRILTGDRDRQVYAPTNHCYHLRGQRGTAAGTVSILLCRNGQLTSIHDELQSRKLKSIEIQDKFLTKDY